MTVASTVRRNVYNYIAGQTVFPFTFPVLEKSHVEVYVLPAGQTTPTLLVNGVDYTVFGEGNDAGGNVTLAAPTVGTGTLTIIRVVPYTQPTDFKNQGSFFPRTHERAFDRVTMLTQQVSETLDRALRLPINAAAVDTELPFPQPGALLGWDAGDLGIRNFTPQEIATAAATPLSSTTPAPLGTAAVGTGTTAARADHVHPLPANATTFVAGLMSSADKTRLDGIATGATANATDAALRDRATHTGTQAFSTITMNTARLLGRTTAAAGAVEEVSIGAGLNLSSGVLSATGGSGSITQLDDVGDVTLGPFPAAPVRQFLGRDWTDPTFQWRNYSLSGYDLSDFDLYSRDLADDLEPFTGKVPVWNTTTNKWEAKFPNGIWEDFINTTLNLNFNFRNKIVRATNNAGLAVTLQSDANDPRWPVGDTCWFYLDNASSGALTFAAGAGATVEAPGGTLSFTTRYTLVEVNKRAANTYTVRAIGVGSAGSTTMTVADEGTNITTSATRLNFVGAGVSATQAGGDVTITIPGGGGGSTTADITHNNGTGSVVRTAQLKLRDTASLLDFGGVGNNSTDNASAYTFAQSSSYDRIYVPEGTFYTTTAGSSLVNKYYYGPGKVRHQDGTVAPGRYTWLTTRPTRGTGQDVAYFFSGDTSKVDAEYFLLGNFSTNLRRGLTEPYYESNTTPHFTVFQNFSGWSGTDCLLTAQANAGATTVTVNSTAGLNVGDVVGFNNDSDVISDTRTITGLTSTTISFSGGLSQTYLVDRRITRGTRTMNPVYNTRITHRGGGDCYAYKGSVEVAYQPQGGQRHIFFTSTGGIVGGDVNASADGVFLTAEEYQCNGQSFDVGAVGAIWNMNRNNATGARGAFWIGTLVKSEGTQAVDSGHVLVGRFNVGIDMAQANADFGVNRCAIGLKSQDRIYFNNSSTPMGDYSLIGNVIGNSHLSWTGTQFQFVANGATAFSFNATTATFNGGVVATGASTFNGTTQFNNTATFAAGLGAATGTFSEGMSSTTGTFAGAVSIGGTATFNGAAQFNNSATFGAGINSTTGTFSGGISATTATFTGALSALSGAFSGAVSATSGTFTSFLQVNTGQSIRLNGATNTHYWVHENATDRSSFWARGVERLRFEASISTFGTVAMNPAAATASALEVGGWTVTTGGGQILNGEGQAVPTNAALYIPFLVNNVPYYVPAFLRT